LINPSKGVFSQYPLDPRTERPAEYNPVYYGGKGQKTTSPSTTSMTINI
jgi:hypothetical protein